MLLRLIQKARTQSQRCERFGVIWIYRRALLEWIPHNYFLACALTLHWSKAYSVETDIEEPIEATPIKVEICIILEAQA